MKKRLKYILLFILLLAIGLFVVSLYYNNSKQEVFEKKEKKEMQKESNKIPGMVSLMLETEYNSNQYEVSNSKEYPTGRYDFNAEKSGCENGGILSWNENTYKLILKTKISDKCYAYFDVSPPDITINVSNIPTSVTEGKTANINCSNGTSTFNQQYNRIEVSSINKYVTCNLDFVTNSSKTNLASYIIGLTGTTQGDGQVVNEKGYRYEGANPNNYIWFNNEYWRIIGVFDSSSHGQSGKNLVKIIREIPIGGIAWDKNSVNDWSNSSLKALLNGAYYNAQDGTNSGNCYGYSTIIDSVCDYTKIGIQSEYRNMIANVTWYLGGSSSSTSTVENYYNNERSSTVYSGRAIKTNAYIGLMYMSDYGYGYLVTSDCTRSNIRTCFKNNWLYGFGKEWTLMHVSTSAEYVNAIGRVDSSAAGFVSRPVVYLNSNINKFGGDGSFDSPYIISY